MGLFSVGKGFCVKHGSDLFPHDPTSVTFDFHPKTTYVLLENHINRFTKQGKQEVCFWISAEIYASLILKTNEEAKFQKNHKQINFFS